MRKSSAVRALVLESLEERLVLSAARAALTPQTIAADKVTAAFTAFDNAFSESVQVNLVMPAATAGTTNYGFFADQLGPSLETLYVDSVKAMGQGAVNTPPATQIRQLILGSASTSLESRLISLSVAYTEYGSSTQSYEAEAFQDIGATYKKVKQIVSAEVGSSGAAGTTTAAAAPAAPPAARAPRQPR